MIREIMQGVFTGTKVEGIPTTNLMAKNLKKLYKIHIVQNGIRL